MTLFYCPSKSCHTQQPREESTLCGQCGKCYEASKPTAPTKYDGIITKEKRGLTLTLRLSHA